MLEISHLRYDVTAEDGNDLGILRDVSLTVGDGKLVVITGPNGGGKTSLAKTIMGLYQPTAGSIRWNGTDITNLSVTDRAKAGVSYGFQQPPRFKGLKVKDLIALAAGKEHIVRKLALATVIGGSLSNLYDRFVRRYVVDYFSVQIGPLKKVVFNLGDICVFLGSVVLILAELVREIRDNRRSDRKKM